MPGDQLVTENDKKELYSVAFVSAVAAKVGYTTSNQNLDRDSTDITVHAGGPRRPALAIQLKASSVCRWRGDEMSFTLKRKNYDDLIAERITPLILVVLEMPEDESNWFGLTESELILRKCAWWVSLKGFPSIETDTKTITLTKTQPFNHESLQELMEKARRGDL